jgi:hypothetical protein
MKISVVTGEPHHHPVIAHPSLGKAITHIILANAHDVIEAATVGVKGGKGGGSNWTG